MSEFPPISLRLTRSAGERVDELIHAVEESYKPYDMLSDRERSRYVKALRRSRDVILDLIADAHEDGQNMARVRAIDAALTVHEEDPRGPALEVADRLRVLGRRRIVGRSNLNKGFLDKSWYVEGLSHGGRR